MPTASFGQAFRQDLQPMYREPSKSRMPLSRRNHAVVGPLTPRYGPGCKRILVSDDYYPALARPSAPCAPERAGVDRRCGRCGRE